MKSLYRVFECDGLADLQFALRDLISDLCDRVIPLQDKTAEPWQIVRFEIWEDSGRIIGFPAMEKFVERTDVAGGQVVCAELAERVAALDLENISDEIYGARIIELVRDVASVISLAAEDIGRFGFRVYDQDGVRIGNI